MRSVYIFFAGILVASCAASSGPGSPARAAAALGEFREHCEAFESLYFGTKHATALQGHAWVADDAGRDPLAGVQVAARHIGTGKLHYVTTGADGAFEIAALAAGEYDVWTCLDGYDELRFHLVVDPQSVAPAIDLYLGPSEASGRRDVVAGKGSSAPTT